MKTRESFRRNSKRSKYLKILFGIFGAMLALYLFGNLLGILGSMITTPIYAVRNWVIESGSTVPLYFRSRNELLKQMEDLEREAALQKGKDAVIAHLLNEVSELEAFHNIAKDDSILAGVVARPSSLPYDALLIDRGSRDGIQEDAIVYGARDQVIGIVSRVFPKSALVTLFSSPNIEATAYLIGPRIYTTAHGEGGGVVRISVPQGVAIKVGDVAILPTLETGILGTISVVESTPTQPEQNGYIVFDTPIQSLRIVSVSTRVLESVTFEEAQEHIDAKKYEKLIIDVPVEFIFDDAFATGSTVTTSDQIDVVEE